MIPVFQRIVDPGRGDCQTACIASILELPYEQVPTWVADAFDAGEPRKWFGAYGAWLRARGLFELSVSWKNLNDWRHLPGVIAVASMPSQRFPGVRHAVVVTWIEEGGGRNAMKVIHDPNPKNEPYAEDVLPFYIHFLVPYDPSRSITHA